MLEQQLSLLPVLALPSLLARWGLLNPGLSAAISEASISAASCSPILRAAAERGLVQRAPPSRASLSGSVQSPESRRVPSQVGFPDRRCRRSGLPDRVRLRVEMPRLT